MQEVTPYVLRVIDVPTASTLPELHELLQAGIGWTDSHLHSFVAGDSRYGVTFEDDDEMQDESTVSLRDLPGRFTYLYDFGDGWEHDITVLGPGGFDPGCVYGEGDCPPEDVGGPTGYTEMLAALADRTHPEHEAMAQWSSSWTPFDQDVANRLVRDTAGQVPASVRLLLELTADGVKLTPGGRLPRALVRQVQQKRPGWDFADRPAQIEEDLPALAELHELLRRVGLLRLQHGRLAPTRAAQDDLQIVRRLRRTFEPGGFDDIVVGVAVAELEARGPRRGEELAACLLPWTSRWSIEGRPLSADDVQHRLGRLSATLQALDLVEREWPLWSAGPSARTLLPRATALAHLFGHQEQVTAEQVTAEQG